MERTLQVRYTPGGGAPSRLCLLQVSSVTAIAQIKLELLVEFGIDLPLQKLMLGNHALDDEKTIEELKLADTDVLTLVNLADESEDLQATQETRPMERIDHGAGAAGHHVSNDGEVVQRSTASKPLESGSVVIIDTDDEDEGGKRRANGALVGLRNQGATCYLNVLVQALFLTPEFRAMLYAIPTTARPIGPPVPPPLPPLETIMSSAPAAAGGAAAASSAEEHKPPPAGEEKKGGEKGEKGQVAQPKDELIYQLQVLFAHLQAGVSASASTEGLTRSFGWGSNELGVQHDVHELNRVLCDRLEELMRALPPDAPLPPFSIASLYRGVLRSAVRCQHCSYSSGREEELYDIPLVVKGHTDVYQCLDAFTQAELLEGDNAYFCERCAVKRTATRSLAFRTLPTILNLQLLRFEYDPSTGRREKIAHAVLFPQLLAMDKYMLPPDEAAPKAEVQEGLKEGEEEMLVRGRVLYELAAVLVHCGTASVGHYLAFVYSLEQKKWFRFNDETVTPIEAADVLAHRWLEAGPRSEWGLGGVLSNPAPYMLVYRRRSARPLPPRPDQAPGTERVALAPVSVPVVSDEDIPKHIHSILMKDAARRAAEQLERRQERETVTVTVYRNRTWLQQLSVRAHPLSTLEMLRAEIVMQAESVDEPAILQHSALTVAANPRYRLRRMITRENETVRPGNAFTASDEGSTLEALRVSDKKMVYLEQDNVAYPEEEISEDSQVGRIFLTIRKWDERTSAPADLADILVPKRCTIGELRQLIARRFRLGLPEELLLVEEETDDRFNILRDDALTLDKCGLVTGDLIYAERLSDKHYKHSNAAQGPVLHSLVQDYRMARRDQLVVWFEETHTSFRARTKAGGGPQLNAEFKDKRAKVGCTTYGGNSVLQVREYVASRLGVAPEYLRFRALDPKGIRDARLIKENSAIFAEAITIGDTYATELQLIVLPAPEALRKGDKVLEVRFHNDTGAFVLTADVVLNKHGSIRELKRQLAGQFGVPPERQLLSEWYDNRLYQVFANDTLSLAQYRIRNGDVLRLDALPADAQEVGGPDPAVAVQVVIGAGWNLTASGHKELAFQGPYIITCRLAARRIEFEELIRSRCKLHSTAPLQLYRPARLPISETDLRVFKPLPLRALDALSAATVTNTPNEAELPLRVFDIHNCDIIAVLVDLPFRSVSSSTSSSSSTDTPQAAPQPAPERPKETSLVIK